MSRSGIEILKLIIAVCGSTIIYVLQFRHVLYNTYLNSWIVTEDYTCKLQITLVKKEKNFVRQVCLCNLTCAFRNNKVKTKREAAGCYTTILNFISLKNQTKGLSYNFNEWRTEEACWCWTWPLSIKLDKIDFIFVWHIWRTLVFIKKPTRGERGVDIFVYILFCVGPIY